MASVGLAEARKKSKKSIAGAARGKAVAERRPSVEARLAYWAKVKPLNIGKGGLSHLLEADRKAERA